MGDHFVLLVDRLLTESTLGAAIQSSYQLKEAAPAVVDDIKTNCSSEIDTEVGPFSRKIMECRICQDEDVDSNMEAPCSCCGSLKYAHRRCVQRWCTEKGDTICEICHQQFKPDYTAPPPIFRFGAIPVNLRRNWEIARNTSNPRFMAISSDGDFMDVGYDNHEASNSRSLLCFRSLALIFVVLLILRHTLSILVNGAQYYSFPLVMLLILRTFGIILPIYVILKAVSAIQRRCHQVPSVTMFDEEVGVSNLQPPTYIISAQ